MAKPAEKRPAEANMRMHSIMQDVIALSNRPIVALPIVAPPIKKPKKKR